MSPENCDDIKILCKYERTPSFYNLKAAYSKLTPDDTISFETFEVDPNRVGPSSCPSKFPPLGSLIWLTDSISDLKCSSKDIIDVCTMVEAKSVSMGLLQAVTLILGAILFIRFTKKWIREGHFRSWTLPGIRKSTGHMGRGLRDGESETLVSSSMSIEPRFYESIGKK